MIIDAHLIFKHSDYLPNGCISKMFTRSLVPKVSRPDYSI